MAVSDYTTARYRVGCQCGYSGPARDRGDAIDEMNAHAADCDRPSTDRDVYRVV